MIAIQSQGTEATFFGGGDVLISNSPEWTHRKRERAVSGPSSVAANWKYPSAEGWSTADSFSGETNADVTFALAHIMPMSRWQLPSCTVEVT